MCVCGDSETEMKQRSKTEEMRISLYSVFGNEYIGETEFPANSSSPASKAATEVGRRRRRRRSPDLEAVDNDRSDRSAGDNFSTLSASSSEICGDSAGFMATEKPEPAAPAMVKPPAVFAAKTTPSVAELEEFFTEAEEYVQKRFIEKYNYDIVKDAPILGGRYQWVRTHF